MTGACLKSVILLVVWGNQCWKQAIDLSAGNLPDDVTEAQLRTAFAALGNVVDVQVLCGCCVAVCIPALYLFGCAVLTIYNSPPNRTG